MPPAVDLDSNLDNPSMADILGSKYTHSCIEMHCFLFSVLNFTLQVVNVTRNGDITFCKAFWGLAENQVMHVSKHISATTDNKKTFCNFPLFGCGHFDLDSTFVFLQHIFSEVYSLFPSRHYSLVGISPAQIGTMDILSIYKKRLWRKHA